MIWYKFHENRMLGSAITNLPLLTLTSWVRVASPFARKVFWNRNGKICKKNYSEKQFAIWKKKNKYVQSLQKIWSTTTIFIFAKNGTEWHFANCQKMNGKYPPDYHIPKCNIFKQNICTANFSTIPKYLTNPWHSLLYRSDPTKWLHF